jgi:hypothetical protein
MPIDPGGAQADGIALSVIAKKALRYLQDVTLGIPRPLQRADQIAEIPMSGSYEPMSSAVYTPSLRLSAKRLRSTFDKMTSLWNFLK